MKKLFKIFIFLISVNSYCQTPSINETKLFSKSKDSVLKQKSITTLKVKYLILDTEKKEAEQLVNSSASTEDIKIKNRVIVKEKEAELIKTNTEIKAEEQKIISISDNYKKAFKVKLEKAINELETLKSEHSKLTDLDLLDIKLLEIEKKEKEIQNFENDRYSKLKSLTYSSFLPSLNKKYRREFFEATYNNDIKKTTYLNSIALSGDKSGAVAQSEIITDNISAFRISFGTVLTAASNNSETENDSISRMTSDNMVKESETDALKRLINGGGNFYTELLLPLLTTYDGNLTDLFTSYSYASFKGAMDIKGFGNNIDTSTGNGSFGINTYVGISSESKKFNFFVQGNVDYCFGSNAFYKNLGLKNEQGFLNGKIITGVTLLSTFKVTAIINTFGSDEKLRSGKVQIGVQILPGI